ncbi:histidine phosphatase family protein [Sphingobacterium sp. lm-10]|uniref:SixA phosphatase family protein n=1 Tax=Sphingobacterium sp. lm-10 TaxID=2944904 RepID=UPI0020202DBA|nr:histidine phosphatase family protein [Sphingobacterium sp. lm-10]MCL7988902.1 histidine phosphatase family protein [Sphingobacterium sp. lm-10]
MRRIYIIRHGKAEDPNFSKRDFDRNLVERGRQDAMRVAHEIAADIVIDQQTLAISSSANRAIQTAELMCAIFDYPTDRIQKAMQIYEAHHLDILKVINSIPDDVHTVFLFGHNPGLSSLVTYLTDEYAELKTAYAAYLEFPDSMTFPQLSGQTAALQHIFE